MVGFWPHALFAIAFATETSDVSIPPFKFFVELKIPLSRERQCDRFGGWHMCDLFSLLTNLMPNASYGKIRNLIYPPNGCGPW